MTTLIDVSNKPALAVPQDQFDTADVPVPTLAAIRAGLDDARAVLAELIDTALFQAMLRDLYARPAAARPAHLRGALMDDFERVSCGVSLPANVVLYRDRRQPAVLFALRAHLPAWLQMPWQTVNIAFDHDYVPAQPVIEQPAPEQTARRAA